MNLNIVIQAPSPSCQLSTHFDPPPEDTEQANAAGARPKDLPTQQYQTIGHALMCAECSYVSVGIPWLPPSRRVASKKMQHEEAPLEYLRYCLVGVSTKTLESYCDDLESSVLGCEDLRDRSLYIDSLSFFERYCFSVTSFLLLFFVCLLGLVFLGFVTPAAVVMAFLTAAVGGFGALTYSQESARRSSLYRLVYHELLRRQGLDDTNGNGIRLVSVKPS